MAIPSGGAGIGPAAPSAPRPGGITYGRFVTPYLPGGSKANQGAITGNPVIKGPGAPGRGGIIHGGGPTSSTPSPAGAPASSSSGLPDPSANLDATYYANTATNLFNTNAKVGALTQEQANNNVALQSALANIAYQQPLAQLKAMQAENARGGLYSSVEGEQQGQLVHAYNEQQNAATTSAGMKNDALAQQIKALQGGNQLYDWAQALASSQRAAKAAANNPASSVPGKGGGSTAPAAPATRTPPAAVAPGSARSLVNFSYPTTSPAGGNPVISGPSGQQPNPAAVALAKALANMGKGKGGKGSKKSGGAGY